MAGPREGARSFGWGSCLVHTGVAAGEGDADLGWCDHGFADALYGTLGLRPRVKPTTGIGRNTPTFTEVGDVSMHQLLQWARVAVVLAIVLAAASCSRLSRIDRTCQVELWADIFSPPVGRAALTNLIRRLAALLRLP